MTSSMTAFARVQDVENDGELTWEIRSVNHRFLEISVRLPEELRVLEPMVRESLAKRLARGKVDCSLRYKPAGDAVADVRVNLRLARRIIDSAADVGKMLHDSTSVGSMDILRWPGVLELEERDLTPLQKRATNTLEQAIKALVDARKREGAQLAELIIQRCTALRQQVTRVTQLMPVILESVRDRLRARLNELLAELDPIRLEQEIALLAQKLDVDEEMDRLNAHIAEVEAVVKRSGPIGRRLDFLMQELNREANTLTSKSNDVEITRAGVEMKVLIEQMREQIQNIE
ncbi:MAG: YicC family protein [Chromatiaceae bacterium]|nr:YicC family protein [Chromatiaceae bacterium]